MRRVIWMVAAMATIAAWLLRIWYPRIRALARLAAKVYD
jgi:hypothetical protein